MTCCAEMGRRAAAVAGSTAPCVDRPTPPAPRSSATAASLQRSLSGEAAEEGSGERSVSTSGNNSLERGSMDEGPEPMTDPAERASTAPVADQTSPVKLDTTKAETEHQAPARRQSCSSTNRGKTP
ncbi:hypothetical protein SRHO_G00165270 [Serrasalmus rhombeus]